MTNSETVKEIQRPEVFWEKNESRDLQAKPNRGRNRKTI